MSPADASAGVVADLLRARPPEPGERVLVVEDASGEIARALRESGAQPRSWTRFAGSPVPPAPWPPPLEADAAVVRLPKGRDALRMTLGAAAGCVASGGRILLHGANEQGARSADRWLEEVCRAVESAAARRHSRVWIGRRREQIAASRLEDWRATHTVDLPGGSEELVSYPGLFAHGRLDPATALLAETLPTLPRAARVLDFGCGAGALLLAVRQRQPEAELHGLDHDALALEAAGRNVPGATLHLGCALGDLPDALRFDQIVSNPPFHRGMARDPRAAEQLCRGAARRLARRGTLWLVTAPTLPVSRWLSEGFAEVSAVRRTSGAVVWHAGHPRGERMPRGARRGPFH